MTNEPIHDPQYRAIQSGDVWLLQRAVRAPADGENGGIEWQDIGPVNVEAVAQERYDRLRECAERIARRVSNADVCNQSLFELAALDSEVR